MATETETTVAPAEPASRWEDFIDIIFSPGEVFDRRANEGWGRPFLILSIVLLVLFYALLPVTGGIWEAAFRENAPPNATPADIQKMGKFATYFGGIGMIIGLLFMTLITGVVIKLVSSLLEPAASWRQSFLIATYSLFIGVLQTLLIAVSAFIGGRDGALSMNDASFGVQRFMPTDLDPVMKALIGRFDLFALWSAALVAIGLIHIVRMPAIKAIITAIAAWALVVLPQLIGAAMSGGRPS